ncbi:MAG: thiamine phosphate synthase [Spirochaetes bacterium]|nr:thiamine phosphate synthase [Spirochaetota bacterium]
MYRIIDVNINRICEGLRVIEDYLRFDLNDIKFKKIKEIRHFIREKIAVKIEKKLLQNRESVSDIGKNSEKLENNRISIKDVLKANFLRIEEGLRVIEEYSKINNELNPFLKNVKSFRFTIYQMEKDIFSNFKKNIDFSLYLSLIINNHKSINIMKYLKEIHKYNKYTCLELEKKEISHKNFYSLSVKIKNYCIDNNISLIIKNSIEIAKEINSDAIIIDENYLPYDIIKKNYFRIIGLSIDSFKGNDITNVDKYDFMVINSMFIDIKNKFDNKQILYKIDKKIDERIKNLEYSFFQQFE